jgi:RND family efflux transporter MFP subunit
MALPANDLRETPKARDLSGLRIHDSARGERNFRWLRWVFVAIGALLLVSGAVYEIRHRAPVVEVTTVHASSAQERAALLNASGYVTPRRRATVAAKITARVEQVLTDEGMHVKAGQVLATLDSSDAQRRLLSAKADRDATSAQLADLRVNLTNAERELKRARTLRDQGVASQQTFDLNQTAADSLRARIASTEEQVRAADARIQIAQQDIDNCIVRAPFDGIIVSKDAQRGEMVSPISAGGGFTRTGIATLVDMNSLEIEVDVNESYIARVKDGQPVTAVLDAYPDWQIPAKVRTIIPSADRQKATVKVRITFDKLDPRILPDMGVKVSFLDDAPAQKQAALIVVPTDALRDENGKKIVFLYKDGKVERRAVKAGQPRGSGTEILAGLSEGDQVIVKAPEQLRDGDSVDVKK